VCESLYSHFTASRRYTANILKKWCALGDDFRTIWASQTVAELQHLAFSVDLISQIPHWSAWPNSETAMLVFALGEPGFFYHRLTAQLH